MKDVVHRSLFSANSIFQMLPILDIFRAPPTTVALALAVASATWLPLLQ